MKKYIESGIYTTSIGKPAVYVGKYETSDGKLRDSFCDIPIELNDKITRENILEFLEKNGTKSLSYITLAPEYTEYDYGYMGKLPQNLYQEIKEQVDYWSKIMII